MHSRISVSSLSFPTLSLDETIKVLQDLGAGSTTLQASKIQDIGWGSAVKKLTAADISVAGLIAPYPKDLGNRESWASARTEYIETLDAAAALNAPAVYAVTGPLVGSGWEESIKLFQEFVEPVVQHAKSVGLHLSVEPTILDFSWVSFVHSLEQAWELADLCDLHVCLDLFHVWDDPDLTRTLESEINRIPLVQVGDGIYENGILTKVVPGDGVIPLTELVGRVARAGYDGVFDIELNGNRIDLEGHVEAASRAVVSMETSLAQLAPAQDLR